MRTIGTIRINPPAGVRAVADHVGRLLENIPGGHEVPDLAFYARRVANCEAVRVDVSEIVPENKQPAKSGKK